MDYKERYEYWNSKLPSDSFLKKELQTLIDENNDAELEDRFYKELSFGTAGLRGKIGVGTNRMNYYTVGRASLGIANFIVSLGKEKMDKGIVIAHDPRHFSKEFARLAAEIYASKGIKVYTFDGMRPTPELAYLVRRLGTVSGINITASHNPKDYNGYKAYWEDGCQVGSEIASKMTDSIYALDYFDNEKRESFEGLAASGMITVLSSDYDKEYLDTILNLKIHDGDELDLDIPIVYTPLNGAGSIPFRKMLQMRGFKNFHIVKEQENEDPDFTTVGYPNPESPAAFKLSEELGKKVGATLLMATDPDSDRFAIEILSDDGKYIPLNGNQTGYLLVNYILEGKKDADILEENSAMVKSIVTSTMSSKMAESYGVQMYESLTGFKNICGKIPFLEEKGLKYIFGYEESVGYAACPDIRDKDGISAGMLIAEAAAYYRKKGKSLWNVLEDLYEKYGFYDEYEPNIVLEGIEGANRISRMMDYIRSNPPKEIAGRKVSKIIDYQNGSNDILHDDNKIEATNALRYFLDDGEDSDSWFAIRPSGTEPKIKFYFYTKQSTRQEAISANKEISGAVISLIESVQ